VDDRSRFALPGLLHLGDTLCPSFLVELGAEISVMSTAVALA